MSNQTSASAAANGPKEEIPPQTLSRCVNPDGVSWPAIWYFPISAPSFPICPYCYSQHIQSTPHAGLFDAAWVDGSSLLACHWNTPRVMSHLAAGDWDAINAFMVERVKIPPCRGTEGHTGPDGSRWYGMTGAWEIQGFVICEACYQDLVAWSPLRRYFTTTPTIKSDEGKWTCDAAVWFITEGLRRAITSPNLWDDLHRLFKRRMEHPSCKDMKNLQAGSTHWYSSKAVPDLIVCAACYLDHFVLDHASSWELVSLTAEQQQQQLDCAMHTAQIYAAWVACKRVSIAENTDEYDGFETLARLILQSPPCSKDDMQNATWYAPQDCTGDAFAICKRCLLGFMVAPGLVTEFKEVDFPRNGNWVCNLNPDTPRFHKYVAKYEAAVKLKNFSIFTEYVSEWAPVPDCPRNTPWTNRKWYGKGNFTACELCYKEALDGTSLASYLDCEIVPNEARCQMYSPRMRKLWKEACENNDLNSFLVLAKERMDVYLLMQIEKQRQDAERRIRLQQWGTLMLASTINSGTEGMAMALGNYGSTMYGNSSIGFNWHTSAGAEGHQQFSQAMGMDLTQAGANIAAMMPLMRRWALLE